jgi:hypothetical protein
MYCYIVMGGDWEDFKIVWLTRPEEAGRALLKSRMAKGYLQWTGQRFIHVTARDSANRFMFQRLRRVNS